MRFTASELSIWWHTQISLQPSWSPLKGGKDRKFLILILEYIVGTWKTFFVAKIPRKQRGCRLDDKWEFRFSSSLKCVRKGLIFLEMASNDSNVVDIDDVIIWKVVPTSTSFYEVVSTSTNIDVELWNTENASSLAEWNLHTLLACLLAWK
jgi:hypothetical protein